MTLADSFDVDINSPKLAMVLAPVATQQFFGLLLLASPKAIYAFGKPVADLIALVTAVLGAIL